METQRVKQGPQHVKEGPVQGGWGSEQEAGTSDMPTKQGPDHARLTQLQAAADASPQVAEFRALQKMVDERPSTAAPALQPIGGGEKSGAQAKSNATGLPDQLKTGVEALSGISLDGVKVHYQSDEPAKLQAHAFAQGQEIHLAAGQEQHLPHEAWHIVQQAQGRVQPTTQMGDTAVNDDAALESEADLMGAKAMQIGSSDAAVPPPASPPATTAPVTPPVAQSKAVTQLALDGENKLPAEEQGSLDNFLTANTLDTALYTTADYATLQNAYSRVRGYHVTLMKAVPGGGSRKRDVKAAKAQANLDMPAAYAALLASARDLALIAGNPAFTAAVMAAADGFVADRAAGEPAAVAAAWPGRAAAPVAYAAAVHAEILRRDALVDAAFMAFLADRRLLNGTVQAVRGLMVNPTVDEVNARLTRIYHRQTTVTREDWLTHLGFAGQAINPRGGDRLHFTTFNNSLPPVVDVRVDNLNVQSLMNALFEDVDWHRRLHATQVIDDQSYHRYYSSGGAIYSANVTDEGIDTTILDREYDRMIGVVRGLVSTAKQEHGRVAGNDRCQRLIDLN